MDCGKRKKETGHALAQMSALELRELAAKVMPYLPNMKRMSRVELCKALYPYIPSTANGRASNKGSKEVPTLFLKNHANSCYVDSTLIALLAVDSKWVVETLLKAKLNHEDPDAMDLAIHLRQYLRDLYTKLRVPQTPVTTGSMTTCTPFRKMLKELSRKLRIADGIDWTREQNDPVDLIHALSEILQINPDIAIRPHGIMQYQKRGFNQIQVPSSMLYKYKQRKHTIHIGKSLFPRVAELGGDTYYRVEKVGKHPALYIEVNRAYYNDSKLETCVKSESVLRVPDGHLLKLASIIVHRGDSSSSGHYMCVFYRPSLGWVLYDDLRDEYKVIGKSLKSVWEYKNKRIQKHAVGYFYVDTSNITI